MTGTTPPSRCTDVTGINKVSVVGAGTMGHGIAQVFAQTGLPVVLVDVNEAVLERHVKDRDGNPYDLMVMRRWVDPEETAILLEQADA